MGESGDILEVHTIDKLKYLKDFEEEYREHELALIKAKVAEREKQKALHKLRETFTYGTFKRGGVDFNFGQYSKANVHLHHAINKDRSEHHDFAKLKTVVDRPLTLREDLLRYEFETRDSSGK